MVASFRSVALAALTVATLALTVGCAAESDEEEDDPIANEADELVRTDGTLRVMSYNIKTGSESSLAEVAGAISKERPDIVGLQEVDQLTNRSDKVRQTDELARLSKLPYRYFGANFGFDGGQYGLAILSRTPLTNTRVIRLDARTTRGGGYEPRIAVAADTVAHGKKITFVTVHASLHEEERAGNARALLKGLGPNHAPAIVVGDMNEKPGATLGDVLTDAGFVDAHRQKTRNPFAGWSSPARFPMRRIDYVFKERAFGPTQYSWVPSTTASDHRPVMVTFTVPK